MPVHNKNNSEGDEGPTSSFEGVRFKYDTETSIAAAADSCRSAAELPLMQTAVITVRGRECPKALGPGCLKR